MESNPKEKARKIAEEALDRLSAELEAGRSDALQKYLSTMGRFHRYSWGNTLLIASQRPDATHVAGLHAWHQLGRSVKKGEKGIMILAPMMVKQKDPPPGREGPEDVSFRQGCPSQGRTWQSVMRSLSASVRQRVSPG